MAPGGRGGTPPPGRGGPPDDKGDDTSDEMENEEGTDEETVSVTSSSQVSAGSAGPPKWNGGKGNIKEGAGGPLRAQMIPPEEEVLGMVIEDHEDTEVRGAGPGHLEEMEQLDLWGLLDQGDSQGEMDCPPLGAHLLPLDWGYPLCLMLI